MKTGFATDHGGQGNPATHTVFVINTAFSNSAFVTKAYNKNYCI